MITDEIHQLLTDILTRDQPLELLRVIQENDNHIKIVVVSLVFNGMSLVKKQQMIYQPLLNHFAKQQIHALTINTFTPQEWQHQRRLA
ncbi:MAG: BolA/IbaG family iron-sulfur metabolism protein [Candidatus Symbiodolus clandestinus]